MVKAVFDNLSQPMPKNHFTVGIDDDVTHTSLAVDPHSRHRAARHRARLFYGLGSDGTVGANKNSIKIIGDGDRPVHAGLLRVRLQEVRLGDGFASALRARADPCAVPDRSANFVACHQFSFLERFDMLDVAETARRSCSTARSGRTRSGTTCRASPGSRSSSKHLRFFVIDGNTVARDTGMGGRVNTIMQTCFFALSGVLPRDEAIAAIKHSIEKTYGKRGEAVVQQELRGGGRRRLAHLYEVAVPDRCDQHARRATGRARAKRPTSSST